MHGPLITKRRRTTFFFLISLSFLADVCRCLTTTIFSSIYENVTPSDQDCDEASSLSIAPVHTFFGEPWWSDVLRR